MTVTRLGQVTGETGDTSEYFITGGRQWTLKDDIVYTGNYSWGNSTIVDSIGVSFAAVDHVRGNFMMYRQAGTTAASSGRVFSLHSVGAPVTAFRVVSDGSVLEVYCNGVLQTTSISLPTTIPVSEWTAIGYHYVSGEGGHATFYVNGVEIFKYEGDDLPGDIDYVAVMGASGLTGHFGNSRMDDFYVDAITADEEDAPPSLRRFLPSFISAGYQSEWTVQGAAQNWQALDDSPGNDGDATIIKTLHTGPVDLYSFTGVTLPEDYIIRAVLPTAVAKRGDAEIDAQLAGVIFDGLNTDEADAKLPSLTYRPTFFRYLTQPDGSAWTEADYAGMKIGVAARGVF